MGRHVPFSCWVFSSRCFVFAPFVIASFAASNFLLLPHSHSHSLPLSLSLAAFCCSWVNAMKCSKQKRFCIPRFCLSACTWVTATSTAQTPLQLARPPRSALHPPRYTLCPVWASYILEIWVNALCALRLQCKGPQTKHNLPDDRATRTSAFDLRLSRPCHGEQTPAPAPASNCSPNQAQLACS